MAQRLPDRLRDLVEIGALVYAADQSCKRLTNRVDYGDKWIRDFRFEIAVRDVEFWNQTAVKEILQETLQFLSDDNYEFSFSKIQNPPDFQDYLEISRNVVDPAPVERVLLFSGGLDSLAGAVEEVLVKQRRVALVSHKPVNHIAIRQKKLVEEISGRVADRRKRPVHFHVLCNRIGEDQGEYTQRSRSFLYATLAVAVANHFSLNDIYFYENGVVSINLPLCGQCVGGRATRTTHPKTLHGYGRLFSQVLAREFVVKNEFIWHTKEDVIRKLEKANHPDLIKISMSCSHTRQYESKSPHCGRCSQCLSRRIAALGSEDPENDPEPGYRECVLTAPRRTDSDRTLASKFIGQALEIEVMPSPSDFHTKYAGELGRIYKLMGKNSATTAANLYDLHRRHAEQVGRVMKQAMIEYTEERRTRRLPDDCLVSYAFGPGLLDGTSKPVDTAADLREGVNSLGKLERDCIQALFEKQKFSPVDQPPGQKTIAQWVGVTFDAQIKTALSTLVKAGYMKNRRHEGARGGYYLTSKGRLAGQQISGE
jgi:hypothetical protein